MEFEIYLMIVRSAKSKLPKGFSMKAWTTFNLIKPQINDQINDH